MNSGYIEYTTGPPAHHRPTSAGGVSEYTTGRPTGAGGTTGRPTGTGGTTGRPIGAS